MKCPSCAAKLSWKSSVLRQAKCPGCGKTLGYKPAFTTSCALAGLLVSAILTAGFTTAALILAAGALVIILTAMPKQFQVLEEQDKPDG